jgi:spore protease
LRKKYVYTDLALEAAEEFTQKREYRKESEVWISKIVITSDTYQRPMGTYVTIEASKLNKYDTDYHRDVSEEFAKVLVEFLPKDCKNIFVVGLGNENATPDALGPKTISHLHITRKVLEKKGGVSAISPGVMLQTGMETFEILSGISKEIKPDVMIVIDALSARSVTRIGCTIQITDTGIQPGSGVGNYRKALNKETMGIPVIAVGIPTVVGAGAIVCDTLEAMEYHFDDKGLKELLKEKAPLLYVTPKDIDEMVERLSFTLSEGLNIAFAKLA